MSDIESFQPLADNRDIARYLPRMPRPYTLAEARKWVRTSARLARMEKAYYFGIEDRQSGRIVGMIGLRTVNRLDKNAEAGYWVGKQFQGRGYAGEAIRLILEFAFKQLRLYRIYAIVHQRNVPSIRVLERAGFTREAEWRRASFLGRRWSDVYGYGILRSEFKRTRRA